MTGALPNLATRPFVNRRPVVRLSLLLWAAGLVLLAGNVWLYWDFLAGRGDLHARLRDVDEKIGVEQRRISALSEDLASFELATQNELVTFLNQRIDQRLFSWSRLFDELADLLPRDVRLQSLSPGAEMDARGRVSGRSRRVSSAVSGDRVVLEIEGRARSDQAILEFVDALYADPDFDRPNLLSQAQEDAGSIRFELAVIYHPRAPAEPELLPLEPEEGAAVDGPRSGDGPGGPEGTVGPARLGRPASSPPELS